MPLPESAKCFRLTSPTSRSGFIFSWVAYGVINSPTQKGRFTPSVVRKSDFCEPNTAVHSREIFAPWAVFLRSSGNIRSLPIISPTVSATKIDVSVPSILAIAWTERRDVKSCCRHKLKNANYLCAIFCQQKVHVKKQLIKGRHANSKASIWPEFRQLKAASDLSVRKRWCGLDLIN